MNEKRLSLKTNSDEDVNRETDLTTRGRLDRALNNLIALKKQKPGTRINPATVAREAGLDRATIYRYHTPILLAIRALKATEVEQAGQRSEQAGSALRRLAQEAQADVAALARINYRISAEQSELKKLVGLKEQRIVELEEHIAQLNAEIGSLRKERLRVAK